MSEGFSALPRGYIVGMKYFTSLLWVLRALPPEQRGDCCSLFCSPVAFSVLRLQSQFAISSPRGFSPFSPTLLGLDAGSSNHTQIHLNAKIGLASVLCF